MKAQAIPFALLLATTACSMTPRLDLPKPPVAAAYPTPTAAQSEVLPDWQAMFGDPRLRRLIALSLDENRDLRIAALNAEAARAQVGVQRAASLPTIGVDAGYTRQRQSGSLAGPGAGQTPGGTRTTGSVFDQFSVQTVFTAFELDLFGRLRSQKQAVLERYLASAEGRRAVRLTVIGTVAETYLAERLADEQLHLTETILADWRASLDLTQRLKAAGQASGVDVASAEGLVRQAQAYLAQRRRERAQATNALTLAVGAPLPDDLPAPIGLMNQPMMAALAAGTPSDLLMNRPDIIQAEHDLRAANADVGAARAAFFPRISLTSAFGFASVALGNLFASNNQSWSFAPAITLPIFRGGELRGNLDLARLRKSVAVATYEKAVQVAFREVADGLAATATYGSQLHEQSEAARAATRRAALASMLFASGTTSRFELLDAQRATYAAQQALLIVRREQLSSAIGLYRALGGGVDPR